MHNTMTATALAFLMAVGSGAALASPSNGDQGSASSGAASSQSTGSHEQQGTRANRQGTQSNGQAPVGFAEEEVTSAPFTVQSVDKKNRKLMVRAPDGTQSSVDVPAGTPGFDSLKKGDQIQLDYFAAAVFGPGNQPGNGASANGSMPSSASTQAAGSGSGNSNIGRAHNIRKVGNSGNTSGSGSTGSHGTTSGAEHSNQ